MFGLNHHHPGCFHAEGDLAGQSFPQVPITIIWDAVFAELISGHGLLFSRFFFHPITMFFI